jgi:hypothetical protein
MDGGHLLMSAKERLRKSVFERVIAGHWSLADGSHQLGLSYRQCKRLYSRFRAQGDSGLVHLSRGRPSTRRRPQALREMVLALCRTEFSSLGPTLAAEKLAERGYEVDHETLRRWLIADGQWRRRRKRGRHRMQRERKAQFGEMVQFDGSHHAWFGPEHPKACLMNLVDDATGVSMALMDEEETTEAAFRCLWKWVERYGIPRALYLDRKSVYLALRPPTLEEQLAGEEPLTAFGLACKKLGIVLITAYSPQAKGRVERKHGVYQDRFLQELRLQGITTIAGANALLDGGFDEQLNTKFARVPRNPADAHRAVCANVDLRDVFCIDEPRTVANDWTIQYRKQILQILRLNDPLPRPGDKVVVRTWLDDSVYLWFRGRPLVFANAPIPQQETRNKSKANKPAHHSPNPKSKPKPAPDHPWRRTLLVPKQTGAKTR